MGVVHGAPDVLFKLGRSCCDNKCPNAVQFS